MPAATLSRLELNRATLARQGLLEPIGHGTMGDAVARVGSLQAQHPDWPPIALWTRAGDRAIPGLAAARRDRSVVRAPLMRITVQVIASADFWPISIITQPLRAMQFRSIFKADVFDSPLGRRLSAGHSAVRSALLEQPQRIRDLDAIMLAEVPDLAENAHRVYWRYLAATLPLIAVPFDGEGYGRARYALAEEWLGPPPDNLDEGSALRDVTERYLAAFGPASIDDLMSYVGTRGSPKRWQAAVATLGDRIVRFVAEDGRELLDLVDAPRPPADSPAPPRLLARWDALLLSHAPPRRERIIADTHRSAVYTRNADVLPSFLVDGMVAGVWRIDREAGRIELLPFGRLADADREALEAQAAGLMSALESAAAIPRG
jgi:hypothetical protein